jgi:hypothetical protein
MYIIPVCVCMYISLSLEDNGSEKRYHSNQYTRNNKWIVGRVDLYAICVVSRKVGN